MKSIIIMLILSTSVFAQEVSLPGSSLEPQISIDAVYMVSDNIFDPSTEWTGKDVRAEIARVAEIFAKCGITVHTNSISNIITGISLRGYDPMAPAFSLHFEDKLAAIAHIESDRVRIDRRNRDRLEHENDSSVDPTYSPAADGLYLQITGTDNRPSILNDEPTPEQCELLVAGVVALQNPEAVIIEHDANSDEAREAESDDKTQANGDKKLAPVTKA